MARNDANDLGGRCWCGNDNLKSFNRDYGHCETCGTLVLLQRFTAEDLAVRDDESDFYGKNYWLGHQSSDLEQPDIFQRQRTDIGERNLFWLNALLRFKAPPASVLELGCAHGSFVALLSQAGFNARGAEMSPWVVQHARETFGIEVGLGTLEDLNIPPASLDVIAMMDVMEHLPSPVETLSGCLKAIKKDGMLLIQMPEFNENKSFEQLVSEKSTFLTQLKADEHLFLFSKRAAREFFRRLGANQIRFLPAIFGHYDMFFVVGRKSLPENTEAVIEKSLSANVKGRMVLAMRDLKRLADRVPGLESDVQAGLDRESDLYVLKDALQNESNLLVAQLADANRQFELMEADRTERGKQILLQGTQIAELQSSMHDRLEELGSLYEERESIRVERDASNERLAEIQAQLDSAANERSGHVQRIANLEAVVSDLERDRADRLSVICRQGDRIGTLESEIHERIAELTALHDEMEAIRQSLAHSRLETSHALAMFKESEADREARLNVIVSQGERLGTLESRLEETLGLLANSHLEIESTNRHMEIVTKDREARLAVIQSQGATIDALQGDAAYLSSKVENLQATGPDQSARLDDLDRQLAALREEAAAISRKRWWRLGKKLGFL